MRRKLGEVASELARAWERFKAWRQSRRRRARIPEPLWAVAVKLVGEHGLHRTASTLKLDYYSLKQRVEAASAEKRDRPDPTFLELAPAFGVARECVIHFEDPSGINIRVHLRGYEASEVVAVGRSFRNAP